MASRPRIGSWSGGGAWRRRRTGRPGLRRRRWLEASTYRRIAASMAWREPDRRRQARAGRRRPAGPAGDGTGQSRASPVILALNLLDFLVVHVGLPGRPSCSPSTWIFVARRSRNRTAVSTPSFRRSPGRSMQSHRDWLLDLHGSVCAYCGTETPSEVITLDHVRPRRGQTAYDRPDNLVLACRECNAAKADTPLVAFLMQKRARGCSFSTTATTSRSPSRSSPGRRPNGRCSRRTDPRYLDGHKGRPERRPFLCPGVAGHRRRPAPAPILQQAASGRTDPTRGEPMRERHGWVRT